MTATSPHIAQAAASTRKEADVRAEQARMWRDAAEKWRLLAAEYEYVASRKASLERETDAPSRCRRKTRSTSGERHGGQTMTATYDPKSFELAEHFMLDVNVPFELRDAAINALAVEIQFRIEEWLRFALPEIVRAKDEVPL